MSNTATNTVTPLGAPFLRTTHICITELSGIDNIGIGIELELPSSELELDCLKDFVPDSELNWNCYYRNWNCKNRIDPGSGCS